MKNVQKGFTLIELMIVVAIIGILAAVAIPAYQDYVVKAKLSKVQSTLDSVKLALAMAYQENGSFPLTASTVTTALSGTAIPAGDGWNSLGMTTYPTLPAEVTNMVYTSDATGSNFALALTMGNIKATPAGGKGINGQVIVIAPTAGATVAGAPAATAVTGTAITWHYACDPAVLDPIAVKYFSNCLTPGA